LPIIAIAESIVMDVNIILKLAPVDPQWTPFALKKCKGWLAGSTRRAK